MTAQRLPAPPTQGNGVRKRAPLPIGRQTKLTPEVQKKIIDAVRAGAFLSVAARYAGVGQSTLMNWLDRGRRVTSMKGKDSIYRDFIEEVEAAEAASEVAANLQWRAAWAKDWHAAEKWLSSRYPDRYGANRDPNSPTAAFAGVNLTINTATGTAGGSNAQIGANIGNVPLETLIEANPRLLSATMHLFDEIDAIYSDNEGVEASKAQHQAPNSQIAPYVPLDDDFEVIEGIFTPVSAESDD